MATRCNTPVLFRFPRDHRAIGDERKILVSPLCHLLGLGLAAAPEFRRLKQLDPEEDCGNNYSSTAMGEHPSQRINGRSIASNPGGGGTPIPARPVILKASLYCPGKFLRREIRGLIPTRLTVT